MIGMQRSHEPPRLRMLGLTRRRGVDLTATLIRLEAIDPRRARRAQCCMAAAGTARAAGVLAMVGVSVTNLGLHVGYLRSEACGSYGFTLQRADRRSDDRRRCD